MSNFFESSLAAGHAGEERFMLLVPGLTRTDGRLFDLVTANGKRVELKTERRTTSQTPNIAVEISSSGKLGAIHAAAANADYIVFLFADDKYFVYEPKALLAEVNDDYRRVAVANSTYESTVVLMPRAAIKHLEVSLD